MIEMQVAGLEQNRQAHRLLLGIDRPQRYLDWTDVLEFAGRRKGELAIDATLRAVISVSRTSVLNSERRGRAWQASPFCLGYRRRLPWFLHRLERRGRLEEHTSELQSRLTP